MEQLHEISLFLVTIFGIALFTSLSSKFIKLPEPIIGVVVGLFFGLVHIPFLDHAGAYVTQPVVIQGLIMVLFLPALLGKETLHLPFHELKENQKPIGLLAVAGSLLTFLLIGLLMHYVAGYSLVFAFTFAALMCATDPITVASIFKTLGVHKKLASIIEGESLFNDGVAVVLFRIASVSLLSYVDKGGVGLLIGAGEFAKVVIGGIAIGALLGYIASKIVKQYDDVEKETSVSILLFFGSFTLAESIHVSGVIAVVVAGLILGNYGKKHGMSPATRLGITNFWNVIASIANSIIFVVVGLEIYNIDFTGKWKAIVLAILIVLISRSLAVYGLLAFLRDIPTKWKHLINWGGLKGSLSLVLALSLLPSFPHREDMIVLTFSTVLFSILFQGLTMGPLIKMLGLRETKEGIAEYEEVLSRYQLARIALKQLKEEYVQLLIHESLYKEEKEKIEARMNEYEQRIQDMYEKYPTIKDEQIRDLNRTILYRQHDKLVELEKNEFISSDTSEKIRSELLEKIEENQPHHSH